MTKTDVAYDESNEPRIYELGYLLVPTIAEDDIVAEVEKLRTIIEGAGGRIFAEGNPALQDLAYAMTVAIENKRSQFSRGYFGWIKFESDPVSVEAMKEKIEALPTTLRILMTKSVREEGSSHVDLRLLPKQESDEKRTGRRPGVVTSTAGKTPVAEAKTAKTESSDADIDEAIDKLVEEDEAGEEDKKEETN